MNPLDYSKAFADFWAAQGKALLQVQEQAGKTLMDGFQSMASGALPAMPEISGMPTDLSAGAAELAKANTALMELWSAASAMSGALAAKLPTAAGGEASVEALFGKVMDPRSWTSAGGGMDDVLGRMAEGPRFADMWEIERRYARVLYAWMNVRRRGLEHNAVVLEAWLAAGRRFTEELSGRASTDAQPLDSKESMALWTEIANRQLLETQRSEKFLQSQAGTIRASTDLRLAQQELVEHFGKQYGFPTRTELDDVHRSVTDLKREMRVMRREHRMAVPATPSFAAAGPPAQLPAGRQVAAKRKGMR